MLKNTYNNETTDFVIRAGKLERYNGSSVSVEVPSNVRIIGAQAFEGCTGLKSITLSNNVVQIESGAFHGCNMLTSITIPSSVQNWDYSFSGCSGITNVIIENGVSGIAKGAFDGCSNLMKIEFLGDINSIGEYAFRSTRVETLTIPESVTRIGKGAFAGCTQLRKIVLPTSVKTANQKLFCQEEEWDGSIDYSGFCFDLLDIYIGKYKISANVKNRDLILNCLYGTGVHLQLRDIYEVYRREKSCPYCGGKIKKSFWKQSFLCLQCGKDLGTYPDHHYYVGLGHNLGTDHYKQIKSSSWYNNKS